MILHSLTEYYNRKVAECDARMPPPGFEWKEIHFVVVLNSDGIPVRLDETMGGHGKALTPKFCLVPRAVKRSLGIASNLLWDNPEYALGVVRKGNPIRVAELHAEFRKCIVDLGMAGDPGLLAITKFLALPDKLDRLVGAFGATFRKLVKSGGNVSFKLAGEDLLVAETASVKAAIVAIGSKTLYETSMCIITGKMEAAERIHPDIRGVWGARPSGANIVSYNKEAFTSFRKIQGSNAPIGRSTAFSYTTALNHLLTSESKQRMQLGDTTAVFWSDRENVFESDFVNFFSEPPKDDPNRNERSVKNLKSSVQSGVFLPGAVNTKFHVLGLAPNASRIVIRFWIVEATPRIAGKICQHFEDIRIAHGPRESDAIPVCRLLVATAFQGKSENIPARIASETIHAILTGLSYPQTLLQAVLRRIRAEHKVSHVSASLMKAYLNRSLRFNNPEELEEMTVSLDIHNSNNGYRLGRLFATLEKIQQEAIPGIDATIREKFYGAASCTPVTVFGNLMRLKNHHLAKLKSTTRRVQFETLLGEIISGIPDFSPYLLLEDQGRFAIGYYHQMQDFFEKARKIEQSRGKCV